MFKDQFAIYFSKKVCINRINYVRVNPDCALNIKRSKTCLCQLKNLKENSIINFQI